MIEPTQIIEESDSALSITWSNETDSKYNAAQLRKACPCASCINEWTGEKVLKDENVADDIHFASISIVGRYALNFQFSDGHNTGIYSFNYLRQLSGKSN
ncbi:MAG: DUF971 domain-containing protein [Acidobacteriota bacterium]|jgi:DUF971 family protein|nr:DUF971 domain-containing protein [Acidobacteriota bacterium]